MTTDIQAQIKQEVISIHRDYARYAKKFLRIRNRAMQIMPFRFNRLQLDLLLNLTGRDIILKSRQPGVSTWVQGYSHWKVTTKTESSLTLADNSDHTINLRAIYNRFYEQWPEQYLPLRRARARNSQSVISYPETDSESVIATAGTKTAGRSGTYSLIHCSEVAFWNDAETVFTGLLQSATPDSRIFLESTPNGAQGTFYEICSAALHGENNWTLHFYAWWWDDTNSTPLEPGEVITPTDEELHVMAKAAADGFTLTPEQIKWRRNKMNEPGMMLRFAQEYPEDVHSCFLTSGQSVFGNFDNALQLDPPQTKPVDKHRHVAGIDWGQTDDYTVLSIIDAKTGKEVYLERWRKINPDTLISKIVEACIKWNVEKIRPELNSFGTNVYLLSKEIENKGADIAVAGFYTTNESKRQMVDAMSYALRNDELHLLNIDWATGEMETFVQTQTKTGLYTYDHMKSAKSDSVIARMAAWDAAINLIW